MIFIDRSEVPEGMTQEQENEFWMTHSLVEDSWAQATSQAPELDRLNKPRRLSLEMFREFGRHMQVADFSPDFARFSLKILLLHYLIVWPLGVTFIVWFMSFLDRIFGESIYSIPLWSTGHLLALALPAVFIEGGTRIWGGVWPLATALSGLRQKPDADVERVAKRIIAAYAAVDEAEKQRVRERETAKKK